MELPMQVPRHVLKGNSDAIPALGGDRPLDELRLAAIAVRLNHQAPRQSVGHHDTEVATYQVQARIEPGGTAGRRDDLVLINVEDIRVPLDLGELAPEMIDITPMGGCPFAIEQPRGSEDIGARAHR